MFSTKPLRILLFLGVALGWSAWWFTQKSAVFTWLEVDAWPPLYALGLGLVPTLALSLAAVFMRLQIPPLQSTVLGAQTRLSLLIAATPLLCLTILGVENDFGMQANLFGLYIGVFTLLYAFLEEMGWRGYLQEEFSEAQKWVGYVFIGLVWYLWHWYFLRPSGDPKWMMIPILIGASMGIGEVARITRSVLVCAALHALVNMLVIYPLIARGLSSMEKGIMLAVCLGVWIPAIRHLDKSES